jgi:TatD DNase family protein
LEPPHLYDCHAHLADERVSPSVERELARFRAAGGQGVLVASADQAQWGRVVQLTAQPGVWGALGVHPLFLGGWIPAATPGHLHQALAAAPRVRAVGEIGLDFQHGREQAQAQAAAFAAQLSVAVAHGLPAVFHNRKSWAEFFAVVDSFPKGVSGVCHNFVGSRELAREVLDRGLMLSFGGPLTYPNARRAREAAKYAPEDRILVETDTPELPPWPCRGTPSTPADVARVLAVLADVRQIPLAALAERVAANFRRLFSPVVAGG